MRAPLRWSAAPTAPWHRPRGQRGGTRSAPCGRCAQTAPASMLTKRADARLAPRPVPRPPQKSPAPGSACHGKRAMQYASGWTSLCAHHHRHFQGGCAVGAALGLVGAPRRAAPGGWARAARLRHLACRTCPSGVSAANTASLCGTRLARAPQDCRRAAVAASTGQALRPQRTRLGHTYTPSMPCPLPLPQPRSTHALDVRAIPRALHYHRPIHPLWNTRAIDTNPQHHQRQHRPWTHAPLRRRGASEVWGRR